MSSEFLLHISIVFRLNQSRHLDAADFKLQVDTAEGPLLVPRFGDAKATLDGRESQILVSEYPYGSHLIKYSTAEV